MEILAAKKMLMPIVKSQRFALLLICVYNIDKNWFSLGQKWREAAEEGIYYVYMLFRMVYVLLFYLFLYARDHLFDYSDNEWHTDICECVHVHAAAVPLLTCVLLVWMYFDVCSLSVRDWTPGLTYKSPDAID